MSRSESMFTFRAVFVLLLPYLCFAKPSTKNTHYLEEILSYVNRDADPCNNFYQYACGNWKPEHLDSLKEKNSMLMGLNNDIRQSINSFLVNENRDLNDVYPNQLDSLRKYYQVCLKYSEEPLKKSTYYLDVIKEVGGFPAVDSSWDSKSFDWINMASHLNVFGCKNLLTEVVYPMFPFPFSFQKMELGIDVALNTDTFKTPTDTAYQVNSEEMLKILRLYEVNDEKSQLIVKDILEFIRSIMEYNIAMSEITSNEIREDFLLKGEDVDDLYRIVLEKYMKIAWNESDEDSVDEIVNYQSYFEKMILTKAVRLINETKPEVVANYLSIKFLYYLHGDEELRTNNNKKFCTLQSMKINGYFTSILYNSTIPNEEQKSRSEDIVLLIKELLTSLQISINNTSWLDQNTMKEAAEKIDNIRINIGQVQDELGDIVLKEMLKLNFTDNYERNWLDLLKFRVQSTHLPFKQRNFLKNTTKPLEILSSAEVNAFYFVLDNSVYIPNGLLNAPVYNEDQHSAVKYSRMGYILGHELFHAFDSIGRHFDALGEERNWWSNISEVIYNQKSRCFKDELNKLYMEDLDMYVNGNKTIDESLADGIGVSMAYDAFIRNAKNEEDQWCLDHGITKEQLFFISFSQLYCTVYSKNQLLNEIDDEHPLDHVRIQPALSHSTKFAEHFQCKEGSKMNPVKKCKLF
ncbi:hypothetical protein ACFFRR_011628 [Megaselia abdita]